MSEVACPGLPSWWINGWLAAVGITVLSPRIRLHWTLDATPVAVLSAADADPVAVLAESWPTKELLDDLPIAKDWKGAGELPRKVSVENFRTRARAAWGHPHSWALTSTMTDLCVDGEGEVVHAPFDPPAPRGATLHDRLKKVHGHVKQPLSARIRDSLSGRAERVNANGLGFDQTRLGSLADHTSLRTDPVIEVLAFFGLAILPVRGRGADRRLDPKAYVGERQKGWRTAEGSKNSRHFHWSAWRQPLDAPGIDALMDVWNPNPENKSAWPRVGVHAGWRSVGYRSRGSADPTKAFGAERL